MQDCTEFQVEGLNEVKRFNLIHNLFCRGERKFRVVLSSIENRKIRIPIIIGHFEAQFIAIQLEKLTPARPLTHDFLKLSFDSMEIKMKKVRLEYDEKNQWYNANIKFESEQKEFEVSCRASDAIAMALRCDSQIYIANESIKRWAST